MNFTSLKTIQVLTFFFITLFVGNETLIAQSNDTKAIEEIGQHLSELLIRRGDINESPFAIKIGQLYPDEDFSKFEDSPALFILSMLYQSELLLPEIWSGLLLQADSLGVNKNAKYFKTYYEQKKSDTFVLTCVLKQASKYYVFSSVVLGWENDKYVMRLFKKMEKYNGKKELEENIYSIVDGEFLKEIEMQ